MWMRSNRSLIGAPLQEAVKVAPAHGPDLRPRCLVVSAEPGAALAVRRRREPGIACNQERLRGERPDASQRLASARDVQPLERRVIPDVVRRFSVRDLPGDLALIEI